MGKMNDQDVINGKVNKEPVEKKTERDKESPVKIKELESAVRRAKQDRDDLIAEIKDTRKKNAEDIEALRNELKKQAEEAKKQAEAMKQQADEAKAQTEAMKQQAEAFRAESESLRNAFNEFASSEATRQQAPQATAPTTYERANPRQTPKDIRTFYVVTAGGHEIHVESAELCAELANTVEPNKEHTPVRVVGWVDENGKPCCDKRGRLITVSVEELINLGLIS